MKRENDMNLGSETEVIEFKKSSSELKEGIISLSSMLNKHGEATLYFGVKNDGTVAGQEIGNDTLRNISQGIANHIKPQIIPTISVVLMDHKNIVKIEARGNEVPYSAYGKYYVRSADEDRELSPNQLKSYISNSSYKDRITEIRSRKSDLTFKQLKLFYVERGFSISEESFENNLSLLNEDGSYNLMAELLADKNDISIKTVTFKGRDKNVIVRRNEYGFKSLITAMDQVLNYVESLNDTKVDLGPHQREEEKLFDFPSFKEAWQNACLHTKWEQLNPPSVYIYSDRLEIVSTGGLPAGLSKEEFFRGISRPVNSKLQKIFGQLGFVEQTGHGVPLIISNYGKQAFEISDNFIIVTIPFNHAFNEKTRIPKIEELNRSQKRIVELIGDDPHSTLNDLSKNSSFSVAYVRKILDVLRSKNIVERIGSNKTGYWQINVF